MTTENIHGPYAAAIAHLKDVADVGKAKREAETKAVDHLLSLNGQKPQQAPEHENPLVAQMLKNVRR